LLYVISHKTYKICILDYLSKLSFYEFTYSAEQPTGRILHRWNFIVTTCTC